MMPNDQCCSTRCVYIATLVLGIINIVGVTMTMIGTAIVVINIRGWEDVYRYPFLSMYFGLPLLLIFCIFLYQSLQILLLITRDNFPTEASLEKLRTSLGKMIVLIIFNFSFLIIFPFFNVSFFGLSWILVFPICFAALGWDLQRKLWTTIPGLPRVSPHRSATSYPPAVMTSLLSAPSAATVTIHPNSQQTTVMAYPNVPAATVPCPQNTQQCQNPPHLPFNPAFPPTAP